MFDVGDIVMLRDDLTDEDKRVAPGWISGYMDALCGKPMSVSHSSAAGWVHLHGDYMNYCYSESWLIPYDCPEPKNYTIHIDELFL